MSRDHFGQLVRLHRKQKNLTQEQLAELVGITSVYLRDIEHGRYTATWVTWLKICTVLDIDIGDIQRQYIIPELNEAGEYLGIQL